jgi:hypothetical protein
LLIIAGAALMTGISLAHLVVARDLWPDRMSALERQVSAQEAEIRGLREEAAALDTVSPADSTRKLWEATRRLVERRRFSWTSLLARLEELVPDGLRLTTIGSSQDSEKMEVRLTAVARRVEDAFAFAEALRRAPEFAEAYPLSLTETPEGVEVTYVVRYSSGDRPRPAAAEAAP